MKNLMGGVLLIVCMTGCGQHKTTEEQPAPGATLKVIEFDGCEYVYGSRGDSSQAAMITHKGNCKYCAERHKPEVRVLREPIYRVPNNPEKPNKPIKVTTQCWWPKEADLPPSLNN